MKNWILPVLVMGIFGSASGQNIGIGTQTPHASAQLDVFAANRGLLVPRVSLTNVFQASPITGPAEGLLVYNTNTGISGIGAAGKGFYFWTGSRWQQLTISGANWSTTGNSNIDSATNYIGTSGGGGTQSLRFKAGGQYAGSIEVAQENLYLGLGAGAKTLLGNGFDFPERNTFLGYGAGRENIRGTSSTYIGAAAGRSSVGGFGNTMVGAYAGAAADSSSGNTYMGFGAGGQIGQGFNNTAIGYDAGSWQTSGSGNPSIGNVTVGYEAGRNLGQSAGNVAIGRAAGKADFSVNAGIGNYNVFIGDSSALVSKGSSRNVIVGRRAGVELTNGSRNVMMGDSAGYNLTTGSGNVFIGEGARSSTASVQNSTAVGARAIAGGSNVLVLGAVSGQNGATSGINVGIGTTNPLVKLHVVNGTSTGVSFSGNSSLVLDRAGGSNHLSMLVDANAEAALIFARAGSLQPPFDGGIFYNTSGLGAMQFRNKGGFTRMMIHDDGNISVGTNTNPARFFVALGTPSALTPFGNSTMVLDGGNQPHYLSMLSAGSEQGMLFGNSSSNRDGGIFYNNIDRAFTFRTANGSNRMVIDGIGRVGISTASPQYRLHIITADAQNFGFREGIMVENVATGFDGNNNSNTGEAAISFKNAGPDGTGPKQWMVGLNQNRNLAFAYGPDFAGGSVTKMVIDSTGNVGIGVTSPTFQLQLSTNSAAKPGSNTWTVSSDERLKKDIHPFEDGMEVLEKINPIWFTYTGAENHPQEQFVGATAQAIQKVAPYMVTTLMEKSSVGDNLLGVDYGPLQFIMINAIKEQQQTINSQKEIIEQQQKSLEEMERRLKRLEEIRNK